MRIKPVFATLVVAVSLIGLSACSDDSSAKNFNDADVSFAKGMIPHHRQATEMATLADRRSADPAVLDLASEIIAAQQPEIDAMSGWLKSWDEEVPSESDEMDNMDHGPSSDMPGMMSSDDIASLEAATGSAFDKAFLTMMIEHHEGAIDMATAEESDGRYSHAVTLAKKIQKDQAAEIVTMESLLQR